MADEPDIESFDSTGPTIRHRGNDAASERTPLIHSLPVGALPPGCRDRMREFLHINLTTSIVRGVALAAASAVAFGVTTPVISRVSKGLGSFETAALLYIGGMAAALLVRPISGQTGTSLTRRTIPWLLLVGVLGGAAAPTLMVWGLHRTSPVSASLVLNLEAVFTVALAWLFFKEPIGSRVAYAISAMVVGGLLVSIGASTGAEGRTSLPGIAAVVAATALWAADNTLTRPLSEEKPLDIVAAKSVLGAVTTGTLAAAFHEPSPSRRATVALLACGAVGYGLSLHLYLQAQRRIGAARTGSVFALGPFVGAAVGWAMGDHSLGVLGAAGAVAFTLGVYLHVTEYHSHFHIHNAIEHDHAHRHDDGHHFHTHDPPFIGEHSHPHVHEPLEHEHEHAPDIHHDHVH